MVSVKKAKSKGRPKMAVMVRLMTKKSNNNQELII